MIESMPAPKKKAKKKKKVEDEDRPPSPSPDPASPEGEKKEEKKKKKAPVKKELFVLPPEVPAKDQTVEEALQGAASWNNAYQLEQKKSTALLTTVKYEERTKKFESIYDKAEDLATILPQRNYFGQPPAPDKDPFDRRVVKQLNDISFEDSEEEKPEEEIKDKRLPLSVITEETLKHQLGPETSRLNLEHHYWIRNFFLDKIGRMAPNLKELSLRRMDISEQAFSEMTKNYTQLFSLDISHCPNIEEASVLTVLQNNQGLERFYAARTQKAITDKAIHQLAALEGVKFLDISYSPLVTDEGLHVFHDRVMPIKQLRINCMDSVTSAGLKDIISCCQETLIDLECMMNDNEKVKGDFCLAIQRCWHLQTLDLSGCKNVDD